jgi:hypothetical protein
LTRGAKLVFRIYDQFQTTKRGSNKLQTLVEKTWMQLVHRPQKQQWNCEQIWPSSLVDPYKNKPSNHYVLYKGKT